ncbi:MAG: hypothetical protein ACYC91_11965 [Solirubrobacteraceae bacterium]
MSKRERILGRWRELAARRAVLGGGLGVVAGVIIIILILSAGSGSGNRHRQTSTGAPALTTQASVPTSTTSSPRRTNHHGHHTPAVRPVGHRAAAARRPRGGARAVPASAPASTSSRPQTTPTTTTTPVSSGATVVLLLLHGGGNATISACGATHHYRTYAAGSPVSYSGSVQPVPAGRWKVKLHIKVCQGGSFADFAKVEAVRDKRTGTFTGTLNAPAAGEYSVRAVLYVDGTARAESPKRHLVTR